jgi:hypothetical protein
MEYKTMKTKRTLIQIWLLCAAMLPAAVQAQFSYMNNGDGTATITGYTGAGGAVTWQSVAGINYFLECSTNLASSPYFSCVATNCPGQPGMTLYTDPNAAVGPWRFYRVGVEN